MSLTSSTTIAGAVAPITSTATTNTAAALAEHATEIRRLGRQTVDSVVEIGRRLVEAKALVRRGQWLPWLDQEFGWSDDTAANYTTCGRGRGGDRDHQAGDGDRPPSGHCAKHAELMRKQGPKFPSTARACRYYGGRS